MATDRELEALLSEVWRTQAPVPTGTGFVSDALPPAVGSREDLLELIRWGLAQSEEETLLERALALAGWFIEVPEVRAAVVPLLDHRWDAVALQAAITLSADAEAEPRIRGALYNESNARYNLLFAWCEARTDPPALACLVEIADESEGRAVEACVDHLICWASLETLDVLWSTDPREAVAERLALRAEPETLALVFDWNTQCDEWMNLKLLGGLLERGDPASLEPLLRHWDDFFVHYSSAEGHASNEEWSTLIELADGLAATQEGQATLERASSDPEVGLLARCLRLRLVPDPQELAELERLRAAHQDPDHCLFAPLQELLDQGGLEGWGPAEPLSPGERIPAPAEPVFLALGSRSPQDPPLVVPPAPPKTGWVWREAVVWPEDAGESLCALPVVATLGELEVRYAGAMVDANQAEVLADFEQQRTYEEALDWPEEAFLEEDGSVRPIWARALHRHAHALADRHMGDPEDWLAWLCFYYSGPSASVRERAEAARP